MNVYEIDMTITGKYIFMVIKYSHSFFIPTAWSLLLFAATVDLITSQSVAMEMAVILQIQFYVFTVISDRRKKNWAIGKKKLV